MLLLNFTKIVYVLEGELSCNYSLFLLQPPTKKNGKVTALKSKAQELGFAFKSGNLTILL